MFDLRDYQRDAVDSLFRYFEEHKTGNPVISLSTGAGKSIIQAAFISETLKRWPDQRFLLLTHVKELIVQNSDKLRALGVPVSVYSAGLREKRTTGPVVAAGIQSAFKKAYVFGNISIVIIDECHRVTPGASTMYGRMLAELKKICPKVRIIGMSATPWRTDMGALTAGDMFDDIAYNISIKELIARGYLSPLVSAETKARQKTDGVGRKGSKGDFKDGELQSAMLADETNITKAAIDEVMTLCEDRRSWLVFCVGVEHAGHVCDEILSRGVSAEVIVGETKNRQEIIDRFKRGETRALVSVGVLTTGFDAPNADALICLRPTMSPGLWVQMVGRITRIAEGKKDGLVCDFTGNTSIHGPIDLIDFDGVEVRTAPELECLECGQFNSPRAKKCKKCGFDFMRDCPNCGAPFPKTDTACPECGHFTEAMPRKVKHETQAQGGEILSGKDDIRRVRVEDYWFVRHEKEGKPDSLRVCYCVDGFVHPVCEWICLKHSGYARSKAEAWWFAHVEGGSAPATVTEALKRQDELIMPEWVGLKKDGKYWRVVEVSQEETKDDIVPF